MGGEDLALGTFLPLLPWGTAPEGGWESLPCTPTLSIADPVMTSSALRYRGREGRIRSAPLIKAWVTE